MTRTTGYVPSTLQLKRQGKSGGSASLIGSDPSFAGSIKERPPGETDVSRYSRSWPECPSQPVISASSAGTTVWPEGVPISIPVSRSERLLRLSHRQPCDAPCHCPK